MELGSFLSSDTALLLLSALGLVGTGIAILRDIPDQRRMADQRVPIER